MIVPGQRRTERQGGINALPAMTTPLLNFLRAIDDTSERKRFAEACGTTPIYLYQLAAQPWPNPRLRLALSLVSLGQPLAAKWNAEPLTLEALLVGTADEGSTPGNTPPARPDAD